MAETSFLWRDTAMRIRERFNPHAPFEARRGGRLAPASNDRFNPRAPCGARRRGQTVGLLQRISTHAPLAGRDGKIFSTDRTEQAFQPTRPLRGATTITGQLVCLVVVFQPTRPLRGATAQRRTLAGCSANFNPRAPCGARPQVLLDMMQRTIFQSTRPLRGATRSEQLYFADG